LARILNQPSPTSSGTTRTVHVPAAGFSANASASKTFDPVTGVVGDSEPFPSLRDDQLEGGARAGDLAERRVLDLGVLDLAAEPEGRLPDLQVDRIARRGLRQ
jgi:hypothetical protein